MFRSSAQDMERNPGYRLRFFEESSVRKKRLLRSIEVKLK
ncbi:hypothetical protein LEP1GSC062_4152 [Leptospira alexanderi serovar Manhao 3 str. L 60]|uniref:Uncharacterized protein n=1 Tax=Leptospira alexanderi serovar Manhao 3 str. L 60 TaxID=1049759 RepID=V6HVT0_9LEPT|nr:hypothetical protein LEP1GSC062_4152 [Leptospira alexanderi serovar Manhao 3 str. L 60]